MKKIISVWPDDEVYVVSRDLVPDEYGEGNNTGALNTHTLSVEESEDDAINTAKASCRWAPGVLPRHPRHPRINSRGEMKSELVGQRCYWAPKMGLKQKRNMRVLCKIVNARTQFGRQMVEIRPRSGEGSDWVNLDSVELVKVGGEKE